MINPSFNIGDIVKADTIFDEGVITGYEIDTYYIGEFTPIRELYNTKDELIYTIAVRNDEFECLDIYRLNRWDLELIERVDVND